MSKYYKNFILCGELDFYCLLCKESFTHEKELEKHIRWEKHRKTVKTQSYFPKFRNDSVFKVGEYLYCMSCNFITTEYDVITNHVQAVSHKQYKDNPSSLLKDAVPKRDSGFIIISNWKITEEQWHGIINSQCVLCNIAVNDYHSHVASHNHVINLICTQIKCDNNQYYRKISEDTLYCFICKKTISSQNLKNHWSNEEHSAKIKTEQEKTVLKSGQYFELNKDTYVVTCRICQETLDYNYFKLHEHRKKHNSNENSDEETDEVLMSFTFYDHGKRRSELKEFGKINYLKLNEGGSKGYCSLCNTYVSAHIINFREHVKGARHIGLLQVKGSVKANKKPDKPNYKSKPAKEFYKSIHHLKESSVFWINNELLIEALSFMFFAPIPHNGKLKCYVCDEFFAFKDASDHFNSKHKHDYMKGQVITSVKREFIREIHSGVYHCGYCNAIYPGWSLLEKHFNNWNHKRNIMNSLEVFNPKITSNEQYLDIVNSLSLMD